MNDTLNPPRQDFRIKRTKNQALACICPEPGVFLGNNNCTYGGQGNYVRVSLATNGMHGQYERLSVKHIKGDETVDRWSIDLTDPKHRPGTMQMSNPGLDQGGYYWDEDSKFYNYVPIRVKRLVQEILDFTEVLKSVTAG